VDERDEPQTPDSYPAFASGYLCKSKANNPPTLRLINTTLRPRMTPQ